MFTVPLMFLSSEKNTTPKKKFFAAVVRSRLGQSSG
jgi:hypothetical protein